MSHVSADIEADNDGWYNPTCSCGFTFGPVPDVETAVDVLMEHAYDAGTREDIRS